jgi:hypothetical protein
MTHNAKVFKQFIKLEKEKNLKGKMIKLSNLGINYLIKKEALCGIK